MSLILQETAANTAAWFEAVNPTLPLNAVGIETDTGKTKVGDGVSPYKLLPYTGTIVNNPVIADLEFNTASAPMLTIDLPVNVVLEFEFSIHTPSLADLTVNNDRVPGAGAILAQVGPSPVAIAGAWSYRHHVFADATTHAASAATQGIAFISTNSKSSYGHGRIIRRKLSGLAAAMGVCIETNVMQGNGSYATITSVLSTANYATLLPNDNPIKLHIGIHKDVRGFFRLTKKR